MEFFYATECTDAIIYNVREQVWSDAGEALGARRSAGYFSQVFKYPINAGSEVSDAVVIFSTQINTTNGSSTIEVPITNLIGLGQVISATGVPAGSAVKTIAPSATPNYFDVTIFNPDTGALVNATATASGVDATFSTQAGKITLWQHEIGVDEIIGQQVNAIESFFETSDLGWVGGGPSQNSPVGDNFWLHLERVEPDFIQSGEMSLQIIGRPYAQKEDKVSEPYYFSPGTGKIDMREQRRELRLRFTSNEAGGNYQMGRVLLNANIGDVRGY